MQERKVINTRKSKFVIKYSDSVTGLLRLSLFLVIGTALNGSSSQAASLEQYWDPTQGTPEADSGINVLASSGRQLFAGGSFSRIGGITAKGIAVWDGIHWTALGSGVSSDKVTSGVLAILPHEGRVYVGGTFTRAGDAEAAYVAMWDGTQWHAMGEGFNSKVLTLAWFKGSLYAGGGFSMSGNTSVQRVARWNGNQWVTVGSGVTRPRVEPISSPPNVFPIPGMDFEIVETATINALATNKRFLYAAGAFDKAGELTANSIAAWDGREWHALGKGLQQLKNGPPSFKVADLAVHQGKLYAGGIFRYAGEVAADGIAVWNGTKWANVGELPAHKIGLITKLVVNNDDLYVGGRFGRIGVAENDPELNKVAWWNGDQWAGLGSGPGNRGLLSLAVFEGALWVGGAIVTGPTPGLNNPSVFHLPGQLTFMRQDSELLLSWPRPDGILRIESTDRLAPASWVEVESVPQLLGHRWIVSEAITEELKFFRVEQLSETEGEQ